MRFASLGSGSKGNGLVVTAGETRLLIDCGFTVKETVLRLERLGLKPSDLTAILVTHEHGDHIKGVGPLARKYKLPVYLTPGTLVTGKLGDVATINTIEGYQSFQVGDVFVTPVAVPHDAREPAQFIFQYQDFRLGVLTDLGSISEHVIFHYQNCHALVLEANHDPQMLAQGPYPYSLKKRVAGNWGHLSNAQAENFLARIFSQQLRHVVIAHISQQNNSLDIVEQQFSTWQNQLETLYYACQDQGFHWLDLN